MERRTLRKDSSLKQLLIVTGDRFPNGDAGAVRTDCLAHIFEEIGYEVRVIGFGNSTRKEWHMAGSIRYYSLRSEKQDRIHRAFDRVFSFLRVKLLLRTIPRPDLILVVSASELTTRFLKQYAAKYKLRLMHDAVEWYSPEEFKRGVHARAYRIKDRFNRKIIDRQFSVIAISTFLEKHFSGRGLRTVRIPAVLDVPSVSAQKHTQKGKTVFVYAGSPGTKDYLHTMIHGISRIDDIAEQPFEFRLIGITEQQLTASAGVSEQAVDALKGKLKCFGRLPREEVLFHLSQADYTVLLRPSELRYARAGFPTKIAESFATATPAVVNLSSDLGLYLKDGENCILSSDCTEEAFAEAFLKALSANYEDRCRMQQAARQTAEQSFDYRRYVSAIRSLLA